MYKNIVDKYYINNKGNIINIKNNKILKQKITKQGYCYVTVSIDGKLKDLSVHREVAKAFISNPENKTQVNHINGIKTDNRVENLEWCTAKENTQHSLKNNLKTVIKGTKCYQSKLSKEDVLYIRSLFTNHTKTKRGTITNLANQFNVSRRTIINVIKNITYKNI